MENKIISHLIIIGLIIGLLSCNEKTVTGSIISKSTKEEVEFKTPVWPNGLPFQKTTISEKQWRLHIKDNLTGDTIQVNVSEEEWNKSETGSMTTKNYY